MELLRDGARIGVVGGGPAGSLFSLFALKFAEERSLHLQITIYEGRDFRQAGTKGCNMCAGVLPRETVRDLESLGLEIPPGVVQAVITRYVYHTDQGSTEIENPDPETRILTVYRGGGPRLASESVSASFDHFLLESAIQRGVRLVPQFVRQILLEPHRQILTKTTADSYDLIVLACGVNSRPEIVPPHRYIPPRTERAIQDEITWSSGTRRPFDPHAIQVFNLHHSRITFGALIPKGHYLNVSLLGRRLKPQDLKEFMVSTHSRAILSDGFEFHCGCPPRVALSMARGYCGNGYVAVGDACITRLYKDGIGSALRTSREAARTAVCQGISERTFRKHYGAWCRRIRQDNQIGVLLFAINARIRKGKLISWALLHMLRREQRLPARRRINSRILWGLFTGDRTYREVLSMILQPAFPVRLFLAFLSVIKKRYLRGNLP